MISGIWWLIFFISVFFVLLGVGNLKEKNNTKSNSTSKNITIQKLHQKLIKHKSSYRFILKNNHITVISAESKIAMLTLDQSKPSGKRKLGNIIVMNFHSVPKYKTVLEELSQS